MKCHGLSAAQLAERAVPPSSLSLLGLLRHLAEAERHWVRRVVGHEEVPGVHGADSWEGAVPDQAVADAAWAAWRAECAAVDDAVARTPLGATGEDEEVGTVSLRWVLVHLVEEYARHNGHADLLRERVDGEVGE
ncbi:uncharacterized protein DUF664 [Motilibacter rhizosphaerae]|uniref:Uncharacterized protein DUF664 n=1 Tax=Motilibacter rhizosphaerae TaxID=598652 RepID=A0A4Q7NR67_9ACTN|nr:DinB family protein [Motilibacter rhizosphaerae]RZS87618.1 uncharacterized protein DUF664 [Motilibacter rhizosphaerae]